jgi:hypothetical protein
VWYHTEYKAYTELNHTMFDFLRSATRELSSVAGKLVVGAVELTGAVATEATAIGMELAGNMQGARTARRVGKEIASKVVKGTDFLVQKAAVPVVNLVANGVISTAEATYHVGSGTIKAALAESGSAEQQAAVKEAVTGATDLAIRAAIGVTVGAVVDVLDGDELVQHVDGHWVRDYVRADGTPVSGHFRGEHLRHVGITGALSESIAEHLTPAIAGAVAALTAPTPASQKAAAEADKRRSSTASRAWAPGLR